VAPTPPRRDWEVWVGAEWAFVPGDYSSLTVAGELAWLSRTSQEGDNLGEDEFGFLRGAACTGALSQGAWVGTQLKGLSTATSRRPPGQRARARSPLAEHPENVSPDRHSIWGFTMNTCSKTPYC
jgi:hypothetical protein